MDDVSKMDNEKLHCVSDTVLNRIEVENIEHVDSGIVDNNPVEFFVPRYRAPEVSYGVYILCT